MKLRMLVLALIAALGSGCASTDKARLAYEVKPDSTVRHGAPNAESYYQLARYYHGQKRLDMAEAAYRKAISLDGRLIDARNALGSLYAERGELEKSVHEFEMAAGMARDRGYIQNNLGFAYFLQGRFEEAYDAVRKALALDGKLERGWANLERIAASQSNTTLVKAVKSRRLDTLPTTLLASSNPVPGKTTVEPVPATRAVVSDTNVAAIVAPIPQSAQPGIAGTDAGTVSAAVEKSEIAVVLVTSSTATARPPVGDENERIEGGKFVLVSASQEVANLAEPITLAKAHPVVEKAETPATVAVPVEKFDIDISKVRIEVSNANGVGGFARKFRAQLREENIPVSRTTNYSSYSLKETVIEYQPGYQNAARAFMSRVQLAARLTSANGPRAGADIRIILGRDALPSAKAAKKTTG